MISMTKELSAAKGELLQRWRCGQVGHKQSAIAPRRKGGPIPLSFAQERLWFLDQLVPGDPFYNIPAVLRVVGGLDVRALEQSLSATVCRHEVLRTSFRVEGGVPHQWVTPPESVSLPVVDLEELEDGAREAEVDRLIREVTLRPFDLGQGFLWRVSVLRPREMEFILVVTFHHIVADGWSLGVWLREVMTLYEAFRAGKQSPLPDLHMQYADYAVWQREWLHGEALQRELRYWRERLQGAKSLVLPTDRPRLALQRFREATCPVVDRGVGPPNL